MKTKEELLVLLIEECGEVIQAATKCLRFGYDFHYPPYGTNKTILAQEIGDVLGIVDELQPDKEIVDLFRRTKMDSVYDIDKKLGDIFEV